MREVNIAAALLGMVLSGGAFVGPAAAQPTVDGVEFAQIDWASEPGVFVAEDSRWGHVTVDYTPGPETAYVNIVANDNVGGDDAWIVRNLIISSEEVDPTPEPVSITFDLGLIGGVGGVDYTVLEYYVNVDSVLIGALPGAQGASFPNTTVEDRTFLTGGAEEFEGDVFTTPGDPQLPQPQPPEPLAPSLTGEQTDTKRTGVPNIEAKLNQCVPAAVANSFEWLSDYWNLGLADNAEQIADDLDTAMGRGKKGAVKHKELIKGKLKYIKDNNLPVTVHFRSTWVGANVTTNGRTARRDGGTPNWDYIKKALEEGQDVELVYQRNGGGAHAVVVTGVYEKKDGTKGIHFQDDTAQHNRNTGGPDPEQGISETSSDIADKDGSINVLDRPSNKVTGVFVESPTVKAMIDRLLKLCSEILGLLDTVIGNGGNMTEQQADQLVDLTGKLKKLTDHLYRAIVATQPTNTAAQQAADDLRQAADAIHSDAKALRDFVYGNPGVPIPEEAEALAGQVEGSCTQTVGVDESLLRGACCLQSGDCLDDELPDQCEALGGTYQGHQVLCDEVTCPLPGACCDEDGSCFEAPRVVCGLANGTYQGDETSCDEVQCPVCGNNIREGKEQCDGTEDAVCPGACLADCTCDPETKIPTVSEWGLMVMTLLVLAAGTVVIRRRNALEAQT